MDLIKSVESTHLSNVAWDALCCVRVPFRVADDVLCDAIAQWTDVRTPFSRRAVNRIEKEKSLTFQRCFKRCFRGHLTHKHMHNYTHTTARRYIRCAFSVYKFIFLLLHLLLLHFVSPLPSARFNFAPEYCCL